MAAIVKANPSLTAGGLAVLRRQYSTTDDGTLTYEADYVCLAQFANNHIGKFRTGAQPPTPIPASMSLLRLDKTPTLYDFQTRTEQARTRGRSLRPRHRSSAAFRRWLLEPSARRATSEPLRPLRAK